MIKLKNLKMSGFRSFEKESSIDFPESGLVLVRGSNPDNNDSSGSGKSSVLLAIAYALDIAQFTATELQSWHTDDTMQVQLILDRGGEEIVISRGKKNSIKIGDASPITGSKATLDKIRQIFGVETETLQAITYRPQGHPGLFMSLTDSEKKSFLTKILGLEKIERAVEQAELKSKEFTAKQERVQDNLRSRERDLEALKNRESIQMQDTSELRNELELKRRELADIDEKIKDFWETSRKKISEVEENPELLRLRKLLDIALQKKNEVEAADKDRYEEYQKNRDVLTKKLQEIVKYEANRLEYVEAIEKLEGQLKHATQGNCPTCLRVWEDSKKKSVDISASIANYQARLESIGNITSEKASVENALRARFTVDPTLSQFEDLCLQLQSQYQQVKNDLTSKSPANTETINSLNLQRATLSTRVQALGEQIRSIDSMNQKLVAMAKAARENEERVSADVNQLQADLASIEKELNAEKDFVYLMGRDGFLSIIFDEVLKEIESEANEQLARLSNVSHVSIEFRSEVETAKGQVKKAITPIVSVAGVETKPKSGLSGGMYTSVEGAVDLALMSVVQRRTGTIPGFLMLDETFNGQGTATKEAAMEILKKFAEEKLVIVIDHNSEMKEMFTQFIEVKCQNGRSEIL